MTPVADNPVIDLEEQQNPGASEPPRIRCPLCGWSPRKDDKWFCTCGYEWNTFDTGGVVPHASINEVKPNVSRAVDGRGILIGMLID
jgi:hypothetical protein